MYPESDDSLQLFVSNGENSEKIKRNNGNGK
jgi:hypothetical protein